MSNKFGLPLSYSGLPKEFEQCRYTNRHGETTVQLAWNTFKSRDQILDEIVDDMVNTAVDLSCINDASTSNEELSNIVGELIDKIVANSPNDEPVTGKRY